VQGPLPVGRRTGQAADRQHVARQSASAHPVRFSGEIPYQAERSRVIHRVNWRLYGARTHNAGMPAELSAVFAAQGGVATFSQILAHMSRRGMQRRLRSAELVKILPGIYSLGAPDVFTRLCGLDLGCGERVAVCLSTAAAIFGFDTEGVTGLHVLNPEGHNLRNHAGLRVHRRQGAPLTSYRGRPLTQPRWTAVEVARSLHRPRVGNARCSLTQPDVRSPRFFGSREGPDRPPRHRRGSRPYSLGPAGGRVADGKRGPTCHGWAYQNPFCNTRFWTETGDCGESTLPGRIAGSPLNSTDSIGTVREKRYGRIGRRGLPSKRSTGGCYPLSATMCEGTAM
jgi:hypothetical protein